MQVNPGGIAITDHDGLGTLVIDDDAISLFDIKQRKRGLVRQGMRYPRVDFTAAARALWCRAWSINGNEAQAPMLAEAFPAPALVDVADDPSGYLDPLRG
jgi:hypothetical protein